MIHLIDERIKEYIISNSKIALTSGQADMLIEQLYNAGYNLEQTNNQLQLEYVDQHGIHSRLIDVDNLIYIACESNYEKVMNVKAQFEAGTMEWTQCCSMLQELCELLFKQHILDIIYKKTEAAQVLIAAACKNKAVCDKKHR